MSSNIKRNFVQNRDSPFLHPFFYEFVSDASHSTRIGVDGCAVYTWLSRQVKDGDALLDAECDPGEY